jgi:hypothetical protein
MKLTTPKTPRRARAYLAATGMAALLALAATGASASAASARNQTRGSDPIVTAYFVLDNKLGKGAAARVCPGGAGLDAMPITFRHQIDLRTLSPRDFSVTTRSGRQLTPICATPKPADDSNEDRTILLVGKLGDVPSDPPVRATVVGRLRDRRGDSLQGSSRRVIPLGAGPRIVLAFSLPAAGSRCPAATAQVLQVVWDSGIRRPGGREVGPRQWRRYKVGLRRADGHERTVTPIAVTDLFDNDNFHELCLAQTGRPLWVSMAAHTVQDRNADVNHATRLNIGAAS